MKRVFTVSPRSQVCDWAIRPPEFRAAAQGSFHEMMGDRRERSQSDDKDDPQGDRHTLTWMGQEFHGDIDEKQRSTAAERADLIAELAKVNEKWMRSESPARLGNLRQ
jgi:hypothetical protein